MQRPLSSILAAARRKFAFRVGILLAVSICIVGAFITRAGTKPAPVADGDWPAYGRDAGGSRYSPLKQINRSNVKSLKIAWTYRTGDVADGSKTPKGSAFEATPIMVDGTLYLSTAFNRVIALDPVTGKERWSYDPKINLKLDYGDGLVSRGVSFWPSPYSTGGTPASGSPSQPCSRRIFEAINDGHLVALDAATGNPCADFGNNGIVDLTSGIANFKPGEYHMTSPPAIINDLVVVGSAINDNMRFEAPGGVVRAFDARSGRLVWSWDAIPRDPADPARSTWAGGSASKAGAANVWSVISADPQRDLVFLPVGAASTDYYGGMRQGSNLYANSVVALRASTGKLVWHFQVVHHDLWDYDVASQPSLITIRRDGRDIPAVAVGTKMGLMFILDRETGKPLIPVEERPVPQGGVPGEAVWPTQPFPTAPRPLAPQGKITADDAWGATPADRQSCAERIKKLRSDGIYTPPSLQGSLVFPGNIGGMHWGAMSYDPTRNLVITNTNRLAFSITLVPRGPFTQKNLDAIKKADPFLDFGNQRGTPYHLLRSPLINSNIAPCTAPPWGTLVAVDATNGAVRWEVPLGVTPELAGMAGSEKWGSLNFGGSIVTAGGLVFIAAARDTHIRAFDIETGEVVWQAELPAGGQATPMTYQVSEGGKQYLVIAAGGHINLHTKLGDYLVAFALP